MTNADHVDVLIVGAGLSGIGAAYHLQERCPTRSYAIVEARGSIGGTWDLFRYPGIRSDSDMHTLGYSFKPWTEAKSIADGPSILNYVRTTAHDHGIDKRIRFGTKVMEADWSSADACWTVTTVATDANGTATRSTITAAFLFLCSGYYSYDEAHRPEWPGEETFAGTVIHPQFWRDDLDYAGKRVVVIGSGATAVTLIPEMAKSAAHVAMLQRSPTYVVSRPRHDGLANKLRRVLPAKLAYGITRWKNVLLGMLFFNLARKRPEKTKTRLVGMVRTALGPDYDVDRHFTPKYNPWDQRLCLVPDNDLFDAIKAGRASVVTDRIERFTPTGLKLESGEEITADVVVTATGLKLNLLGDVVFHRDGERVELSKGLTYKGMMANDVPNLAFAFGYTNASWTLKADLTSAFVCRLLNYMDKRGVRIATPTNRDPDVAPEPFLDFTSGYVQRAAEILPKQGSKHPWKLHQNYARDLVALRFGKIDDGTLLFSNPNPERRAA